ncbi:MAG: hypothetical protein ACLGQW_09420 [Acidobacteriota bacterium]|uniref:hypothetical protein n=1 Tax=Fundidesulfovibrio agrisoli TaxID=2922717 RepID=UPI001FABC365|nr:hypothetical protein [Fundidesulfovibrio agrisoli]
MCQRAAALLSEKVLDVLERLLEAEDDKVQLAAAKEIKDIARQTAEDAPAPKDGPGRVFVVTGIDRKPGGQ